MKEALNKEDQLFCREVTFATGEDVLVLENALSKKKDSTTNHKWELSCEGDFSGFSDFSGS